MPLRYFFNGNKYCVIPYCTCNKHSDKNMGVGGGGLAEINALMCQYMSNYFFLRCPIATGLTHMLFRFTHIFVCF